MPIWAEGMNRSYFENAVFGTNSMSPGFSDLPIAADVIHMGYDWLVSTILNLACQRFSLPAPESIIPVENDVAKGQA